MLAAVSVVVQLLDIVLLAAFLLVLRRYADVRGYFGPWTWGFAAYAVALGSVVVRYYIAPSLSADAQPSVQQTCDALYLLGKAAFFLSVMFGAARFAQRRQWVRVASIVAGPYCVVAISVSNGLNDIVAWQAPLAVVTMTMAAALILVFPESRRSIGSRITGSTCALHAALWTIYGIGFLPSIRQSPPTILAFVARYNSFIDLLAAVVLAFGMVVLVLEEANFTADQALARLATAHESLRQIATRDALTGVANRRAFRELSGQGDALSPGAVALIDLDGLKLLNDALGHAAGDQLIAHFASCLARSLPQHAWLYRWGGDEFVIVVPDATASAVARLARAMVDEAASVRIDGSEMRAAASIGVAAYADGSDLERAVAQADAAMYTDKMRRKGTPSRPMLAITSLG